MAPLHLSLPMAFSNRMQLWHPWQRAPHNNSRVKIVALLSSWIIYMDPLSLSMYLPIIKISSERTTKVKLKTSSLASRPHRLQPKFIHVPGKAITAPDVLSRWLDHSPKVNNDKEDITLFPSSLFVHLIDTTPSDEITLWKKPTCLPGPTSLRRRGTHTIWSQLSDWTYNAGILAY